MARGRSTKRLKRSSSPEIVALKLVVDNENKRVLYAEAGADFVDFLVGIVSLPLAFIVGLDMSWSVVSSVAGKLYESVMKMENSYFEASKWRKDELLRPALPSMFAGLGLGWPCKEMSRRAGRRAAVEERRDGGGGGGMMYMITNELEVTPMSTASILALMKSFNVNIENVEERMVTVGQEEKIGMLMALFSSQSVFTEVFLSAKEKLAPEPTTSQEVVQCRKAVMRATRKAMGSARSRASSRKPGGRALSPARRGDTARRGGRTKRNQGGARRIAGGAKSAHSSANRGRSGGRSSRGGRGARSLANRGRGGGRGGKGEGRTWESRRGRRRSSSASSGEDCGLGGEGGGRRRRAGEANDGLPPPAVVRTPRGTAD